MMPAVTSVVSVRVTPGERELLELAAEQTRSNLSEFMRRKAVEAAEMDVLDHRIVTIAAEHWVKFEAWASAPAKEVPALQKLAASRPVWQD